MLDTNVLPLDQPLADFDLLIVVSASVQGRTLVANNLRHYTRIPGLKLENWLTP